MVRKIDKLKLEGISESGRSVCLLLEPGTLVISYGGMKKLKDDKSARNLSEKMILAMVLEGSPGYLQAAIKNMCAGYNRKTLMRMAKKRNVSPRVRKVAAVATLKASGLLGKDRLEKEISRLSASFGIARVTSSPSE